jgi:hypothetical protein
MSIGELGKRQAPWEPFWEPERPISPALHRTDLDSRIGF